MFKLINWKRIFSLTFLMIFLIDSKLEVKSQWLKWFSTVRYECVFGTCTDISQTVPYVQIKIFLFFQYFCRNRTEHFVIVFFILYSIFLSYYAYYFEKYFIDICQLQPPWYECDREWDSWESDYPVASLSIHQHFINQYFVLRNYFLWSIMQIYVV